MDVKAQNCQVKVNTAKSRFEVSIGAETAVLEYARGGSIIGLIYLFVPESLQYQGSREHSQSTHWTMRGSTIFRSHQFHRTPRSMSENAGSTMTFSRRNARGSVFSR
jgi:hypothetical protein